MQLLYKILLLSLFQCRFSMVLCMPTQAPLETVIPTPAPPLPLSTMPTPVSLNAMPTPVSAMTPVSASVMPTPVSIMPTMAAPLSVPVMRAPAVRPQVPVTAMLTTPAVASTETPVPRCSNEPQSLPVAFAVTETNEMQDDFTSDVQSNTARPVAQTSSVSSIGRVRTKRPRQRGKAERVTTAPIDHRRKLAQERLAQVLERIDFDQLEQMCRNRVGASAANNILSDIFAGAGSRASPAVGGAIVKQIPAIGVNALLCSLIGNLGNLGKLGQKGQPVRMRSRSAGNGGLGLGLLQQLFSNLVPLKSTSNQFIGERRPPTLPTPSSPL